MRFFWDEIAQDGSIRMLLIEMEKIGRKTSETSEKVGSVETLLSERLERDAQRVCFDKRLILARRSVWDE